MPRRTTTALLLHAQPSNWCVCIKGDGEEGPEQVHAPCDALAKERVSEVAADLDLGQCRGGGRFGGGRLSSSLSFICGSVEQCRVFSSIVCRVNVKHKVFV